MPRVLTPEEAKQLHKRLRPSKYRNKRCVYDGKKFDSKKEAARYMGLKVAAMTGKIRNLECQKKVAVLGLGGVVVCHYFADFVYEEQNGLYGWWRVYEDVKSPATKRKEVYRLKFKLLAAQGIHIREV